MATKKPVAAKTVATPRKRKTAEPVAVEPTPKKTTRKKPVVEAPVATPKLKIKAKSPKEIATEKGEPWVSVLRVELDPDNIGNGAFELDWNDKFIVNLVRAGYKGKDDSQMVDQWFQEVCRNVLAENYEQWAANQPGGGRTPTQEDLGGGKTSVS